MPEVKGCKTARGRTRSRRHAATSTADDARRTKRRLRREVRFAGCALLALMPLVSACTLGWSSRPSRVLACSIADTTAENNNLAAVASREQATPRTDSSVAPGAVVLSDRTDCDWLRATTRRSLWSSPAMCCPTTASRTPLMREVDEALARAYAQHEQSNPRRRAFRRLPHWPARALKTAFRLGSSHRTRRMQSVELQWPRIVLTLEREWGDRFEKMARLLLEVQERQGFKVFLFTSCHRAEGRTTLVLTLARALARQPMRTLVVDADLTGPMVARLLGLRPEVGSR